MGIHKSDYDKWLITLTIITLHHTNCNLRVWVCQNDLKSLNGTKKELVQSSFFFLVFYEEKRMEAIFGIKKWSKKDLLLSQVFPLFYLIGITLD